MTRTATTGSYEMPEKDWIEVRALPGNTVCVDCGVDSPDWASVTHGILLCLQCSGPHRGLGTHLSFVRSVKMDSWTDKQLKTMKIGGNQALNDYLDSKGVSTTVGVKARAKYDNDVAQLYKLQLKARVEGLAVIPTELPASKRKEGVDSDKSKYQGFGSAPPPPPKKSRLLSKIKWIVPIAVMAGAWVLSKGTSSP